MVQHLLSLQPVMSTSQKATAVMGGKNAVAHAFGEQWRVIDKINEKVFKSTIFTTIPALQQFTASTCKAIERCAAVGSC